MLSKYCSSITNNYVIKVGEVNKLIPNLGNKKNYVIHYKNLHKIKPVLALNKPIYVGFRILELSKLLMYDFHYGYFKNNFNSGLLFADTDSLVYEIKEKDDIYEKIYSDRDLFDFSDYPKNSKFGEFNKFYDVVNKKSHW